jgi:hypothetical protein
MVYPHQVESFPLLPLHIIDDDDDDDDDDDAYRCEW